MLNLLRLSAVSFLAVAATAVTSQVPANKRVIRHPQEASAVMIALSSQRPASQQMTKEQAIEKVCQAAEVTGGSDFDEVRRIATKLGLDRNKQIYLAVVNDTTTVNAWTLHVPPHGGLICVPLAMIHFMGDAEGELAFIIAHETGHALDDVCKDYGALENGSALGALKGALAGGGKGAAAGAFSKQTCESRADEIGFHLFTQAGYNPFDAAGAFGRLEMYLGDTSTGLFATLAAMGNSHPMTPDRIKHMRLLLISYEQKRGQ